MIRGAVFTFQTAAGRPGGRELCPPYMGAMLMDCAKIPSGEIRKFIYYKG